MSYIGKEPQTGAYSMLDALTASATASYSLTLDSVAFVPESANHLIVSLNGHIQKAGSSFTVSSSTLTFSSALTSSDSIDFVLALGNVLDIGTPSDATVTNAKTNFVSTSSAAGLQIKGDGTTDGTLQLNCSQNSHGVKIASPAHSAGQSYTLTLPTGNVTADKFLKVASVSGSGTTGIGQLSFADAGGNAPAFEAKIGSSQNIGDETKTKLQFDTEIFDTAGNYDHSSNYRFTPTTAGKYFCYLRQSMQQTGGVGQLNYAFLYIYKNGSIYKRAYFDYSNNNGYASDLSLTATIDFNGSSDYIEAYAETNAISGNGQAIGSDYNAFGAFKLGGV